jgi:hypothetical protein
MHLRVYCDAQKKESFDVPVVVDPNKLHHFEAKN